MPLVGNSPSTTLMFTSAWTTIIAVMPSATNDPNASWRASRCEPAPRDDAEAQEHSGCPEQAKLFADHGVDEIGVRFRKEEQLLNSAHQSAAKHAACTNCDQRLHHLEAIAQRIGFGIHEREESAQSIRRTGDQEVEHRHGGYRRANEIPVVQSAAKTIVPTTISREGSGAKVWFKQNKAAHGPDDDGDGQEGVGELVDAVHAPLERQRGEEHGGNLGNSDGWMPRPPRLNHRRRSPAR